MKEKEKCAVKDRKMRMATAQWEITQLVRYLKCKPNTITQQRLVHRKWSANGQNLNTDVPKCGGGRRTPGSPSHCRRRRRRSRSPGSQFPTELNSLSPRDPASCALALTKEREAWPRAKTHVRTVTAALIVTGHAWQRPRRAPAGARTDPLWSIGTMGYYSALKRNGLPRGAKPRREHTGTAE